MHTKRTYIYPIFEIRASPEGHGNFILRGPIEYNRPVRIPVDIANKFVVVIDKTFIFDITIRQPCKRRNILDTVPNGLGDGP